MGVTEGTIRVGLTRLKATGKIVSVERGLYETAPAAHPLHQVIRQWQRKRLQARPWIPGEWIGVHDGAVLKSNKASYRHHLLALSVMGFARLRDGLHVRPNNFSGGAKAQAQRLKALGLAEQAVCFQLSGLTTQLEAQARRLWKIDSLVKQDQMYLDSLRESLKAFDAMPLEEAARESLLLGRKVIAHLVRDPVLPPALMPPELRVELQKQMAAYQLRARRLWMAWLRGTDQEA